MSYQTGNAQAGLPSDKQPFVKATSVSPLGIAGLSMPGCSNDGVSACVFAVQGRIMQHDTWFYRCSVCLALVGKNHYPVFANVYAPNVTVRILAQGIIGTFAAKMLVMDGIISRTINSVYALRGLLPIKSKQKYLLEGLLQSQHDIAYLLRGTLGNYSRKTLCMSGTLHELVLSKITARGRINGIYQRMFGICGTIGSGMAQCYKVISILETVGKTIYKVGGTMQTEIETMFLKITGLLKVPQFIASVPRRLQDFVTNKRWWR